MCPSAYESISGLALTNQNYLEAVELLKYYKEQLLKLDNIGKSNNVSRLRTFFNKIEIIMQNFSYEI